MQWVQVLNRNLTKRRGSFSVSLAFGRRKTGSNVTPRPLIRTLSLRAEKSEYRGLHDFLLAEV